MIYITDYSPEELEELKESIQDKIEIIKENSRDDETREKIDRLSEFLKIKYSSQDDSPDKIEKLNKLDEGLSKYQRFKQAFEKDLDIDPGRLLGLTDGIFGMVMTLLVFGIALPEMQIISPSDFMSFIHSLTPTIGITIVSFILISSFWIYHHEFIKVKKLNIPYLWLNIFFLICISFIPFTTSLIGNYSHFFLSEAIFGLNVFLTILTFISMFRYAFNRKFLEKMPTPEERSYIYHTFYILMGLTVVVNLLDFNISSNFIYMFLLVPIISTVRDIRFKLKS